MIISQVKGPILNFLKGLYNDESDESLKVDIVYAVAVLSGGEFDYDTETAAIEALNLSKRIGRIAVQDGVEAQASEGPFIIRATDLEANGITVDELSTNDKILYNGQWLSIASIDKTIGFVIQVVMQGG
jgi:hypothetical protein